MSEDDPMLPFNSSTGASAHYENNQSSSCSESDYLTEDESYRLKDGPEIFARFSERMRSTEEELDAFLNATRQLGGGGALLTHAQQLRNQLAHVLALFQKNAEELRLPTSLSPNSDGSEEERQLNCERIPQELDALASCLDVFEDNLKEFRAFEAKRVTTSINSFRQDLKYIASCLRDYTRQIIVLSDLFRFITYVSKETFETPDLQRHINNRAKDIAVLLNLLATTIAHLNVSAIPELRSSQRARAVQACYLAPISISFCLVVAVSFHSTTFIGRSAPLGLARSLLLFSILLNCGCTAFSLLAAVWHLSPQRRPTQCAPWWILFWIKIFPISSFIASIISFALATLVIILHLHELFLGAIMLIFFLFCLLGFSLILCHIV